MMEACWDPLKTSGYRPGGRIATGARLAATLFLAATVLLWLTGIALAHAAFVRSEPSPNSRLPEPPKAVTIWFTEPLDERLSSIEVLSASGQRANMEEATVLPGDSKGLTVALPHLSEGTYTVAWKSFSTVDGHATTGSFVFHVGPSQTGTPASGTPAPAPTSVAPGPIPGSQQPALQSTAEPVFRWLGLLSILAIVGSLAFELFVSRPILTTEHAAEGMREMGRHTESRTLNLVWLATGLFIAASVAELIVRAWMASTAPSLQTLGRPLTSILQTGWGGMWVWRMNLAVATLPVLVLASIDRRRHGLSGRREWQIVALVFTAGSLLTLSLASHGAASTDFRTAAVFSDFLHLLAAGVWVGGIIYLALVLPQPMRFWRQHNTKEPAPGARPIAYCPGNHVTAMGRFSVLAILSVGVLVITGLYASWVQVSSFPALATPYGVTLLVKLAGILPLLLLGAFNLLRLRPRMAHDGTALQSMGKTLNAQAMLAVLVLLAVGVLVSLEPARQAMPSPVVGQPGSLVMQQSTEGTNIKVLLEPGALGANLATIYLTDRSGKPISNASAVTLQFTYLDGNIGSSPEKDILDHGGGIWVAHSVNLSVAGDWQALVVVKRPDAFDARTTFRFRFPSVPGNQDSAPNARTGNLLWGVELLAIGLLFGGVGLVTGVRKSRAALAVVACGGMALLAGAIIIIASTLA